MSWRERWDLLPVPQSSHCGLERTCGDEREVRAQRDLQPGVIGIQHWNPEGKHQRGEDVAGVISVVLSFPSGKVNIATIPIREMK